MPRNRTAASNLYEFVKRMQQIFQHTFLLHVKGNVLLLTWTACATPPEMRSAFLHEDVKLDTTLNRTSTSISNTRCDLGTKGSG
jgi:hypothetical protein